MRFKISISLSPNSQGITPVGKRDRDQSTFHDSVEKVRLKSGLKDVCGGPGPGSIQENGEERMNWREIAKGRIRHTKF